VTLPRLIHPINITIEKIVRGSTWYDEDAREPIQQADRAVPVVVKGQPKWTRQLGLDMEKGGARETSAGYVLFRKIDLDAASVTLEDNDRIVKMGHVDCDVYVNRIEWTGHYPDQDGPSLVKAHFMDRSPSKGVNA
jgi:hypothetical protein